jgi:hypothetical protein
MDVIVSGDDLTVKGRVFSHTDPDDPDSALETQLGGTLSTPNPLSLTALGLQGSGEVGIVASAFSATVDSSVTNFCPPLSDPPCPVIDLPKPDLVPTLETCSPLTVRVTNMGGGAADPSTTRVEVLATIPIPRDFATPSIAAGKDVVIKAGTLPDFCRVGTGCNVTATADVNDVVMESVPLGETNNRDDLRCVKVGP